MQNALAELVLAHCERTGDTLSGIAKRGGMSRQTLSGLVNRPDSVNTWPRHSTLEALARGLGVSVESVRQVAAERRNGGDQPPPRVLVATLMAHAEGLTDGEVEVVLATAQALKRLRVAS
jgi:transcriptional regulator with XRE-family HTH domain